MTPAPDAHRPTADGREELAGSQLPMASLLLREERKGGGRDLASFSLRPLVPTHPGERHLSWKPFHPTPQPAMSSPPGMPWKRHGSSQRSDPPSPGCEAQRQGSVFTTFLSRHQIRGPHTYTVTAKEMLARPTDERRDGQTWLTTEWKINTLDVNCVQ